MKSNRCSIHQVTQGLLNTRARCQITLTFSISAKDLTDQYHVAQTVVQHVKVGGVCGVGDVGAVRRREEMKGAPVQTPEERVFSEVPGASRAQPLAPVADQSADERTRLLGHLRLWRKLKIVLFRQKYTLNARVIYTHTCGQIQILNSINNK